MSSGHRPPLFKRRSVTERGIRMTADPLETDDATSDEMDGAEVPEDEIPSDEHDSSDGSNGPTDESSAGDDVEADDTDSEDADGADEPSEAAAAGADSGVDAEAVDESSDADDEDAPGDASGTDDDGPEEAAAGDGEDEAGTNAADDGAEEAAAGDGEDEAGTNAADDGAEEAAAGDGEDEAGTNADDDGEDATEQPAEEAEAEADAQDDAGAGSKFDTSSADDGESEPETDGADETQDDEPSSPPEASPGADDFAALHPVSAGPPVASDDSLDAAFGGPMSAPPGPPAPMAEPVAEPAPAPAFGEAPAPAPEPVPEAPAESFGFAEPAPATPVTPAAPAPGPELADLAFISSTAIQDTAMLVDLVAVDGVSTAGRDMPVSAPAIDMGEVRARGVATDHAAPGPIADPSGAVTRLVEENRALRETLTGISSVIVQLENPLMPAIVGDGFVIPAHRVTEFVRIGRQLHSEGLVHARSGNLSIISAEHPGLVHATRTGAVLGQLDETQIVTSRLGAGAPPGATSGWHIHEVMLALGSLEFEGPAACVHTHGPFTTALSLDDQIYVLEPVDLEGAADLPQVAIVDQDERTNVFLRQLTEGVQISQSRIVVVRGHGAYAMGPDLQTAWRWASTLEHSMKIQWLARMNGSPV